MPEVRIETWRQLDESLTLGNPQSAQLMWPQGVGGRPRNCNCLKFEYHSVLHAGDDEWKLTTESDSYAEAQTRACEPARAHVDRRRIYVNSSTSAICCAGKRARCVRVWKIFSTSMFMLLIRAFLRRGGSRRGGLLRARKLGDRRNTDESAGDRNDDGTDCRGDVDWGRRSKDNCGALKIW
ncbi:hypothetical protein C8R44DRAFT_754044 [Mycena epipterygia]|nr:hypothetical protein C8R44DRAFT_754044 [Mycena epipterygia]